MYAQCKIVHYFEKKIAEKAEPKDKITGEDFKRLKEKKKKSKSRGAFTDRD